MSSLYHSPQLKVERRFGRGLSWLASYTFSKLIDNVTGAFAGEAISGTGFQGWTTCAPSGRSPRSTRRSAWS